MRWGRGLLPDGQEKGQKTAVLEERKEDWISGQNRKDWGIRKGQGVKYYTRVCWENYQVVCTENSSPCYTLKPRDVSKELGWNNGFTFPCLWRVKNKYRIGPGLKTDSMVRKCKTNSDNYCLIINIFFLHKQGCTGKLRKAGILQNKPPKFVHCKFIFFSTSFTVGEYSLAF